jgi:hypothetical protein
MRRAPFFGAQLTAGDYEGVNADLATPEFENIEANLLTLVRPLTWKPKRRIPLERTPPRTDSVAEDDDSLAQRWRSMCLAQVVGSSH